MSQPKTAVLGKRQSNGIVPKIQVYIIICLEGSGKAFKIVLVAHGQGFNPIIELVDEHILSALLFLHVSSVPLGASDVTKLSRWRA